MIKQEKKMNSKIESVSFPNKTDNPPFYVAWRESVELGKIKLKFNKKKRFQTIGNAVDFYWEKVRQK
jgi:hypothetical protein